MNSLIKPKNQVTSQVISLRNTKKILPNEPAHCANQIEPLSEETQEEKIDCSEDMQKCVAICKEYPTLKLLSLLYRSQGKRLVESFALACSLSSLSYIYCHSNEVRKAGQVKSMSLNLYFAILADTGYGKTSSLEVGKSILNDINQGIKEVIKNNEERFSTELPASREGMQRNFGTFPVRAYILDEAQNTVLSKNDIKQEVFGVLRNLFDPYKFHLSSTKKKENDNLETASNCLAVVMMAGTTQKMQTGFLSEERANEGTANRFLIVCPNAYRGEMPLPVNLEEISVPEIIDMVKDKVKKTVRYEKSVEAPFPVEPRQNDRKKSEPPPEDKFKRMIEYIYSEEIESYFDVVESDIAKQLDEYEKKKLPPTTKILQITRTGVIKKRMAYLLWAEKDCNPVSAIKCAEDATFLADALYQTALSRGIFDQETLNRQSIVDKILGLKEKCGKEKEISLSRLTAKKGLFDLSKHGNNLKSIFDTLSHLAALGEIKLTQKEGGKAIKFSFPED